MGSAFHRRFWPRVKETGVTVHLSDHQYDSGPIIAQWPHTRWRRRYANASERVLKKEHDFLRDVANLHRGDNGHPALGCQIAVARNDQKWFFWNFTIKALELIE